MTDKDTTQIHAATHAEAVLDCVEALHDLLGEHHIVPVGVLRSVAESLVYGPVGGVWN